MPAPKNRRLVTETVNPPRDKARFDVLLAMRKFRRDILVELRDAYRRHSDRTVVEAWATRYKIDRPWVVNWAIHKACKWQTLPRTGDSLRIDPCGPVMWEPQFMAILIGGRPPEDPFDPERPPWASPLEESLDEYLARSRRHYLVRASRFKAEGAREEPALSPAPQADDVHRHAVWLVHYKFKGWSYGKIAAEYPVSHRGASGRDSAVTEKAIKGGIERLACRIDLSPQPLERSELR